jgi:hypothetical protein
VDLLRGHLEVGSRREMMMVDVIQARYITEDN